MKIILCPDKFRGSLSAIEAANAMNLAIKSIDPNVETVLLPMADGGEGTLELLNFYANGSSTTVKVNDPLGREIDAAIGFSLDNSTAIIEMATASGLKLLQESERNPLKTNTYGTGQLIRFAIEKGVKNIIIGIGGSATNDAGMGMACALGVVFFDEKGEKLTPSGENLIRIARIDLSKSVDVSGINIQVACDVTNPLFGINGAAFVYAPQKGATQAQVEILDKGLQHFAKVINQTWPQQNHHFSPGAGAAGGLGYGLLVFLHAQLTQGVELLMQKSNFEKHLINADFVFTGEGKIDQQTLHGKLVSGICQKANDKQILVIAFCGTLETSVADYQSIGLSLATSILTKPITLENAQAEAFQSLFDATARIFTFIQQLKK
jgi:glycerate kinase